MRHIIIITALFLASLKIGAQQLEIKIKENGPYKVFDKIFIHIYLINNTPNTLTYFNSIGTSWDSFKEQWELKVNHEIVDLFHFKDAHEGRYTEKTIISLSAGEKKLIRTRSITLNSPGEYTLSYTQEQAPEFVAKGYASSASAYQRSQQINKFKVNGTISFTVNDMNVINKKVENEINMSWEEWKVYAEKELYENRNHFRDLESALKNPEKVFSLDIACSRLIEIHFDFCNIQEIPAEINKLSNLKVMSFPVNNITHLPNSIGDMKKLEKIDLQDNKNLKYLPSTFIKLVNLKDLSLYNTGIESLPEGISNLPIEYINVVNTPCKKTKDYIILKNKLAKKFRD